MKLYRRLINERYLTGGLIFFGVITRVIVFPFANRHIQPPQSELALLGAEFILFVIVSMLVLVNRIKLNEYSIEPISVLLLLLCNTLLSTQISQSYPQFENVLFVMALLLSTYILLVFVRERGIIVNKISVVRTLVAASIGLFLSVSLLFIFSITLGNVSLSNIIEHIRLLSLGGVIIGSIHVLSHSVILEEFLFRGFFQTWLLKKGMSPLLSIIVQSFLFTIPHLNIENQGYISLVSPFISGVLFGWIVYRTRSLMGSIIGHGTFNLLIFLL